MIRVGTSGFLFEDWAGTVFPRHIRRREWLPYYEHVLGFRVLELNSTFYTLLAAPAVESLLRRTTPAFRFVLKVHRAITHGPFDRRVLDRFRGTLALFRGAGKLAGSLAQFPPSFRPTRDHLAGLDALREELGHPLFVEFRNPGWAGPFVWKTLASMGLSWCAPDLPRPCLVTTVGPAYVRLHGRNPQWFESPELRYDYRYSDDELRALTEQVFSLEEQAGNVLVFFNNCNRGQAAQNALRLEELLADVTKQPVCFRDVSRKQTGCFVTPSAALPGSATPGS